MRAKFEHRKTKELKELLKEEETRVETMRTKLTSDIETKTKELVEKKPTNPSPAPPA